MINIGVDNQHALRQVGLFILEFCKVVCHVNLSVSFRDVTATVQSRFGGIFVWTEGSFWMVVSMWFSFFVYFTSAITYGALPSLAAKPP
jgi:hypothetical protein